MTRPGTYTVYVQALKATEPSVSTSAYNYVQVLGQGYREF